MILGKTSTYNLFFFFLHLEKYCSIILFNGIY